MKSLVFYFIIGLVFTPQMAMSETIEKQWLGKFSQGDMAGWEEKSFAEHTHYQLNDAKVLQAESEQGASCLYRKARIDLQQTPWLNWSWKTQQVFENIDERSKKGDDFVARIYVVIDGGLLFWKTVALNYVWSSSQALGDVWPNPYTSNATMLAVESGAEHVGVWRSYKRNVREDFRQLLGKDVRYIDGIALMTDTDNHAEKAVTYYGDIYFSNQ